MATTNTMQTPVTMPVGEYLYNTRLQLTGFTDYGVSLQDINSGRAAPPPQGARIDITFEGVIQGEKVNGTMRGVDYLNVRADGRFELCLRAEITTDDGARIAFYADAIAYPTPGAPGIVQIRESAKLTTAAPAYEWVNTLMIWITGYVDMNVGRLDLHAYAA
jgi:hypothetical protein